MCGGDGVGDDVALVEEVARQQKEFFADFWTIASTTKDFQYAGSALFTALKSNSDAKHENFIAAYTQVKGLKMDKKMQFQK